MARFAERFDLSANRSREQEETMIYIIHKDELPHSETAHRFEGHLYSGAGRARHIDIHASGSMETEWLES
jgi:hypothetical protein